MNLHAKLRQIKRKKRGVSPIIAAILLIGLAVLAGAAIYLVVIPMLTPTTSSSQVTATMSGTVDTTSNQSTSTTPGAVSFTLTFGNKGLKEVNVTITGVTIAGLTQPGSNSIAVTSGGSDVTTSGFIVQSGQTTDVTITVFGSGTVSSGAAIKVNTQLGNPVNAAKPFSFTV